MALTDKLTAIADAIRAKTGGTEAMTLDQMPTQIAGISAGGSGAEQIYETEFTIAETPSAQTALVTIETGLTANDLTAGDNILWTVTLKEDAEADTSIIRLRAQYGWMAVHSAQGYVYIGTPAFVSDATTNGMGLLWIKSASPYCASIGLYGRGDYAGFGKPVAGKYSLKMYRVKSEYLLPEVTFP